ncbi:MAG: RNA polymerase sigma factor [Ferrimicrobium sp.]
MFNRHQERVFRHVCRLTQSREDAEDVVCSAFLELWRRRIQVRLVSIPWPLVTTRNFCRTPPRSMDHYSLHFVVLRFAAPTSSVIWLSWLARRRINWQELKTL